MQDIPPDGRPASQRLSKTERQQAIRDYMVEKSSWGDHLFFGAQGRVADHFGFHRRTIIRDMKEMEERGEIERTGERWAWKKTGKRTIVYRVTGRRIPDVTRCPSGRTTRSRPPRPKGRGAAQARPHHGRRRRLMENPPAPTGQVMVMRATGDPTPFNAGDAIAATLDMYGMPIPSQIKARIGKAAKELLEDGFQPEVVVVACLTAVRMARPHLTASFALEIQNARAGEVIGWNEYRAFIAKTNFDSKPELAAIRDALKGAFK